MLFLSTKLANLPIISLRTGGRIGTAIAPIVNPHNLHVDGFYCQSGHNKSEKIVLDMAIREFSAQGIVVNDLSDLADIDELIRLQAIIELAFDPVGKSVRTGGKKIGKVTEYAIDHASFFVQKLYVQPSVWRGLSAQKLVFDRSNVLEVTPTTITVSGPEVTAPNKSALSTAKLQNYSASTSLINENE